MHAAVCRTFDAPLSLESLELRAPGPGEVAVDIKACAICHSDIVFATGGWGGDLPAVFGHEAAGVVSAVGAGVADLAPGDAVVATMVRSCGTCACCSNGLHGVCESASFALAAGSPLIGAGGEAVGQGMKTAAFAEQALVDRSQVVRIDGALGWEQGALLACGAITGFGAVANTAEFATRNRAGATVAVIGAGGVGLHAVQAAAHFGAHRVIAVDLDAEKLAAAEACGATHGVTAGPTLTQDILALTSGRGVDFAFVTVGAPRAIAGSLTFLAPGGWSVLVGIPPTGARIEIDPVTLAASAQRIVGSKMGDSDIQADIPMLIDLYRAGRWRLDELIAERFDFRDINAAMAASQAGAAGRNVLMF